MHDDGWGVWMGLMMLIIWVPLLFVLFWALREFGWNSRERNLPPDRPRAEDDARELARRSYARGELDRERYLQIMEDLEKPHSG